MGFVPTVVLRAALLVGGLNPPPTVTAPEFRAWFESAVQGNLDIPNEVAARAQGFRYAFVLGLMGDEWMPGHPGQNIEELLALGVPDEAIHRISGSSNTLALQANLVAIANKGPEPLVIVGHGRGAWAALAFALREPAFVSERVSALILIRGPFGGSDAVDHLFGVGVPTDGRRSSQAPALPETLRTAEVRKLERGQYVGNADLAGDTSARYWDRLLSEHAAALPIVGPRTFYIESVAAPVRRHPLRFPIVRHLETYEDPDDGLVAAGDQSVVELGTRLGILDVGQNYVTRRSPGRRRHRQRDALTQAIVMAVGRPPGY